MFEGRAEEAMTLYVSLFPDGRVLDVVRRDAQGSTAIGTIVRAKFEIAGQTIFCSDSAVKHAFTFTPSCSLFAGFDSEGELDRMFAALSQDGAILMEPANYGFSRKFAWINDRFGVSWQLNLP
jgi:predicted 3-demethylubiquinone-9 3-methyltransferase (glyoxalase superfamily)